MLNGRASRLRFLGCLFLVIAVSGAQAWWRAYSTIRPYDDEGTLMMSVRQFFDGKILYDELRSVYGPLYYLYQWVPHVFTGAPISHDSVRLVSVVIWVAAALLLFVLVHRATGSLVLALAAHFVGFRVLSFIGDEPAHPQEMCILLLLGIAVGACLRRPASVAWLGALAGALAVTKVNLAILVAAAFGPLFVFSLPRGRLRRTLGLVVVLGAIAIPFALMSAHTRQPWGLRLAMLVAVSLASASLVASQNRIETVTLRDLGIGLVACLATTISIAWFVLARGTTVVGMLDSLVLWPRAHFAQNWNLPLVVLPAALVWTAACVPMAWLASRGRLPEAVVDALKLALALLVLILGRLHAYHELLSIATPMLWLVAAPPAGSARDREGTMLRPLLALLGVLQVLYSYPVAGGQAALCTVIVVAIAALCVSDTLPRLAAACPPWPRRAAPAIVTVLLCAGYSLGVRSAYREFQSLEPLGLPGAMRLRVEPALAASLRRLNAAAAQCSMLVTMPGLYSFNLFSGKPAQNALRSGPWMRFLSDAEQASAVRQIEEEPCPCAVFSPEMTSLWMRGEALPDRPLVRFLREGFRVEFETGNYRFLVRK